MADASEIYNRQDNSTRPPAKRVETDPSLWQQETSVRHMQDPPMPYANNPGTPPKSWKGHDESGHPSPYRNEFDHSENQLDNPDNGQRREWRNSGWGRQNSGVGVGN
jgi:hypothetical protein